MWIKIRQRTRGDNANVFLGMLIVPVRIFSTFKLLFLYLISGLRRSAPGTPSNDYPYMSPASTSYQQNSSAPDGTHQVRIQDLVKEGPQLPRPKVSNVAEWSCVSEASYLWLGSLEAFGFLIHKYAISHILETLFL